MVKYYLIDRGYYKKTTRSKLVAGVLVFGALLVGGWAYGPILWYQGLVAPEIGNRSYVSPLPDNRVLGLSDNNLYNPNSWFVAGADTNNLQVEQPVGDIYYVTIPALKIIRAKVEIHNEDLTKSLVHYHNTAAPGSLGSAVIFGHSVLPQFYNPKNYKTIFSTLHTLKNGESIVIEYDNVLYHYQVSDKYEVNPDDMYVLDQNLSDKTLKLITCTPPGTYAKRLVVESRLVPFEGIEELYEKAVVSGS